MSIKVNNFTSPSAESTNLGGFVAQLCTMEFGYAGWAASGTKSVRLHTPTSSDSCLNFPGDSSAMTYGMVVGQEVTISATAKIGPVALGGTEHATRSRKIVLFFWTGAAYVEHYSAQIANVAGNEERLSVTVTVPVGATRAFFRLYHGHTTGEIYWDAIRVTPGTETNYFDGNTPDVGTKKYDWRGAMYNSVSVELDNQAFEVYPEFAMPGMSPFTEPDSNPYIVTPTANADYFWVNRLKALPFGAWTVAVPNWLQEWAYDRYGYMIPEPESAGGAARPSVGQLTPD